MPVQMRDVIVTTGEGFNDCGGVLEVRQDGMWTQVSTLEDLGQGRPTTFPTTSSVPLFVPRSTMTRLKVLHVYDFDTFRAFERDGEKMQRHGALTTSDWNTWYADTRFSFGQLQFEIVGEVTITSLEVTRGPLRQYADQQNDQSLTQLYNDDYAGDLQKMLKCLGFFKHWSGTTFARDMGFHGEYDFMFVWSSGGGGWAPVSSMCNGPGKSVGIAGGPSYRLMTAARHEIGHMLGSPHDNNCPDCNDQYENTEGCPDCGEGRMMGGNRRTLFSTFGHDKIEAHMYGQVQQGVCKR